MLHRFFIVVAVFFALTIGVYLSVPNRQAAFLSPPNPDNLPAVVPNGGLIVRESELDFGNQSEASSLPYSIEIFNPTDQRIDITGFRPICGGAIRNEPISILPHESSQLELSIHFSPRELEANRPPLRYHYRTVVPYIAQCPGKHPGWTISGYSYQE